MFKITLFLSLFISTNAAVCTIKTCATVLCAPVTHDNCAGIVKKAGGYCGCCDACIIPLGEGDKCVPNFLLGVESHNQCADGLYCNTHSGTCVRKVSSQVRSYEEGLCAKKLKAVIAEQAQHVVYGLERPHCDTVTGEYLGMQYSGSQAVCVTTNGTFIQGYMVYRWLADDMDCQCARDEFSYKQSGLVGKTFSCAQNGNYASIGCTGSVCYCQDKNGNPVGTSRVAIGEQNSLNC